MYGMRGGGSGQGPDVAGTERGFEAGSRFEPGCGGLQPAVDNAGAAQDCERMLAALDALHSADVAQLRLLYDARIAGMILTHQYDLRTTIAVLVRERDAALARLRADAQDAQRRVVPIEIPKDSFGYKLD